MNIIERSTEQMDNETIELFKKCKPYLDKGYGFYKTIRIVKKLPNDYNIGNLAWYKRFRDYAKSQGYEPLR